MTEDDVDDAIDEFKPRKFYKTIIEIEVLSEEPYNPFSLEVIEQDTTEGDCSCKWGVKSSEIVDGPEMAGLLINQSSCTELFNLDEDGNDVED